VEAKIENGILFIPHKNADKLGDVALRIFHDNKAIHYASTRLGDLEVTKDGIKTECVDLFEGKKFDVRLAGNSKPIIEGLIGVQKAETKKSKEGDK
jgi:hypothetical protein